MLPRSPLTVQGPGQRRQPHEASTRAFAQRHESTAPVSRYEKSCRLRLRYAFPPSTAVLLHCCAPIPIFEPSWLYMPHLVSDAATGQLLLIFQRAAPAIVGCSRVQPTAAAPVVVSRSRVFAWSVSKLPSHLKLQHISELTRGQTTYLPLHPTTPVAAATASSGHTFPNHRPEISHFTQHNSIFFTGFESSPISSLLLPAFPAWFISQIT